MTVLDMNPATLPADAQSLYETMAARAQGEGRAFRRPLCGAAQPSGAGAPDRGARLLFEVRGHAAARTIYQFIVLHHRARQPAPTTNGTTTSRTRAPLGCRPT
jgi:hypothetical protein